MTIQQFIEAAIEGGWENKHLPLMKTEDGVSGEVMTRMYWTTMFPVIALDPEAWKAVGKVKGWFNELPSKDKKIITVQWMSKMHMMINALIKGKTLQEYIKTLK